MLCSCCYVSQLSVSDLMALGSCRTLSEISEPDTLRFSVDLVSAANRNIGFFKIVAESHWLHHKPTLLEAIRRYDELWMPLISDLTVGSTPPMVLPPLDVEWVWFCHTLNPVSYRRYCESRFLKIIGRPTIFDEHNEDYAVMRCRDVWVQRYPNEPFENEIESDGPDPVVKNEHIFMEVMKHRSLYTKFAEPYMADAVYLIAARQRYKGFLYMLQRFSDGCSRLVPALDIMLMWLTHQSYPTAYAEDMKEMEGDMGKVVSLWGSIKGIDVENTKKLWDKTFDQPYEKAGGGLAVGLDGAVTAKPPPVHWVVSDTDANTKCKSLMPRFLLEVCVFVRLSPKMKAMPDSSRRNFLRLQMVRCHRELKIDKPVSDLMHDSWRKGWHLYCEFGTRGVVLDLRHRGGGCLKGSGVLDSVTFLWNDLLRAQSLTLERVVDQQVRIVASITPPVQASYLLKCVPDRVTDDSGAMISDVILRMNRYRPQEGRWLSRTVLDHAGRECFVVRIRVGDGFWRRGAEVPSAVKWEDRIIEIREGSWSYVAGSIGRAPEKVVGTATPKEREEQWKASWKFSTGDELMIQWDSSLSVSSLSFFLKNEDATDSRVKLLRGRKMQYQVEKEKNAGEDEEEEEFVTVVRFTEDDDQEYGRATALLNWKLLVVDLSPEEDAVFAMLLCVSILRSVSEMKKEDVGRLLVRRRLKEAKMGARDWGSVTLHPCSWSPSISTPPHLQPWYWNAKAVVATDRADQPVFSYSPVEGGEQLYKRVITT